MAFGSMLNTRLGLIATGPYYIAKMATIAMRYSFLRRQFDSNEGNKAAETLVIQYQMQ